MSSSLGPGRIFFYRKRKRNKLLEIVEEGNPRSRAFSFQMSLLSTGGMRQKLPKCEFADLGTASTR
jgi:hypothetical protein